MGKFGDMLSGSATSGIGAGLSGALSGGITSLLGRIGEGKRLQRQVNAQKKLNEQAAKLNYEYGEKAAQNAYQRQMEMYERSYNDQSYSAMRKQMEDAGLSVGLMYGGSGSGGAGGATTGAPQGETGGAEAGQAPKATEHEALALQRAQMGLGMQKLQSEIDINKASVNKINADAEAARANAAKATEEKITTMESREAFIEELKQRGMETWIRNVKENWKAYAGTEWGGESGTVTKYGEENKLYGFYGIAENSYVNEEQAMKIAKTIADTQSASAAATAARALAELNSQKAKGYWTELMNATMHANADAVRASAQKLAAEWTTGEYTNWKTWASIAKDAVGAVAGAL